MSGFSYYAEMNLGVENGTTELEQLQSQLNSLIRLAGDYTSRKNSLIETLRSTETIIIDYQTKLRDYQNALTRATGTLSRATLSATIATTKSKIEELNAKVQDLRQKIANLNTNIYNTEAKINELKNRITQLESINVTAEKPIEIIFKTISYDVLLKMPNENLDSISKNTMYDTKTRLDAKNILEQRITTQKAVSEPAPVPKTVTVTPPAGQTIVTTPIPAPVTEIDKTKEQEELLKNELIAVLTKFDGDRPEITYYKAGSVISVSKTGLNTLSLNQLRGIYTDYLNFKASSATSTVSSKPYELVPVVKPATSQPIAIPVSQAIPVTVPMPAVTAPSLYPEMPVTRAVPEAEVAVEPEKKKPVITAGIADIKKILPYAGILLFLGVVTSKFRRKIA